MIKYKSSYFHLVENSPTMNILNFIFTAFYYLG